MLLVQNSSLFHRPQKKVIRIKIQFAPIVFPRYKSTSPLHELGALLGVAHEISVGSIWVVA
jgi:hypothetical protein